MGIIHNTKQTLYFLLYAFFNSFQHFERVLALMVIFIINRYFAYRIRILCIWLYMGTWFKSSFCDFRDFSKHVPEVWIIFVLRFVFDILEILHVYKQIDVYYFLSIHIYIYMYIYIYIYNRRERKKDKYKCK